MESFQSEIKQTVDSVYHRYGRIQSYPETEHLGPIHYHHHHLLSRPKFVGFIFHLFFVYFSFFGFNYRHYHLLGNEIFRSERI